VFTRSPERRPRPLARVVGPVAGGVLFDVGVSWPYVLGAALMVSATALSLAVVRPGD
jgi:hypothetical protein